MEEYEKAQDDGLMAVFYFTDNTTETVTIDNTSSDTVKVDKNKKVKKVRLCCWNYHNYNSQSVAELTHYENLECDQIFNSKNSDRPAKRIFWPGDPKTNNGVFHLVEGFANEGDEYFDVDTSHFLAKDDDAIQYWTHTYVCFIDGKITFSSIDKACYGNGPFHFNDGLRCLIYFKDGSVMSLTIDDIDFVSTSSDKKPKDVLYFEIQPWNSHVSFPSTYGNNSKVEDLNTYYLPHLQEQLKEARERYEYSPYELNSAFERAITKVQKVYTSLSSDYTKKIDVNKRKQYDKTITQIHDAYVNRVVNIYATIYEIGCRNQFFDYKYDAIKNQISAAFAELDNLGQLCERIGYKASRNEEYENLKARWNTCTDIDRFILDAECQVIGKGYDSDAYKNFYRTCIDSTKKYEKLIGLYTGINKDYEESLKVNKLNYENKLAGAQKDYDTKIKDYKEGSSEYAELTKKFNDKKQSLKDELDKANKEAKIKHDKDMDDNFEANYGREDTQKLFEAFNHEYRVKYAYDALASSLKFKY